MIKDLQEKIISLRRETGTTILAHSYQSREIIEIADIVGDTFKLSVEAKKVKNENLIVCGVKFMAETVKILNPEKSVYLSNIDAGCPMAEQLEPELLKYLKLHNLGYAVVAYINTTAELKALCDVCVTSSSAIQIVNKMEEEKLLFIPDCNLGDYVKKRVLNKEIKLFQGGCPVHAAVTVDDFNAVKLAHPKAVSLIHPECIPEIVEKADYVGSTAGIMNYARNSKDKEFIIGTEMSIAEHLSYENPDKSFYLLSKKIICPNMKVTILPDLYKILSLIKNGEKSSNEIIIEEDILRAARRPIDRMISLGEC